MTEYNHTSLTTQEAEQINNWLTENSCNLSEGHIILRYGYWIFGAGVMLEYISTTKRITIEIREEEIEDEFDPVEKTINILTIGDLTVPLTLSSVTLNKFLTLARQNTATEWAEECELSGFGLFFHIDQSGYRIFAGSREIESISFN